jgi:5-methylcytosine-specific restriction endonuclease McrA
MSAAIIERLRLRDGDYCHICEVLMRFDKSERESAIDATVDHIQPVSNGGKQSSMSNMKLAHRWCNNRRGILPVTEELSRICRTTILKQRKRGLDWLSQIKGRPWIRSAHTTESSPFTGSL